MQDPKPNLSMAALHCNRTYWESVADQSLHECAIASSHLEKLAIQA